MCTMLNKSMSFSTTIFTAKIVIFYIMNLYCRYIQIIKLMNNISIIFKTLYYIVSISVFSYTY